MKLTRVSGGGGGLDLAVDRRSFLKAAGIGGAGVAALLPLLTLAPRTSLMARRSGPDALGSWLCTHSSSDAASSAKSRMCQCSSLGTTTAARCFLPLPATRTDDSRYSTLARSSSFDTSSAVYTSSCTTNATARHVRRLSLGQWGERENETTTGRSRS